MGLGRFELPTSPLSGVRSNQLSYRPGLIEPSAGGAGRDRTGDLLNANQALSQLSYSPRNRFPVNGTETNCSGKNGDRILVTAASLGIKSRPTRCRTTDTRPVVTLNTSVTLSQESGTFYLRFQIFLGLAAVESETFGLTGTAIVCTLNTIPATVSLERR